MNLKEPITKRNVSNYLLGICTGCILGILISMGIYNQNFIKQAYEMSIKNQHSTKDSVISPGKLPQKLYEERFKTLR